MEILDNQGYTIKESIESLGFRRVIEELGFSRVIEEFGLARVIEELGFSRVIEEFGLASILKYLLTEEGKIAISLMSKSDKQKLKELLD